MVRVSRKPPCPPFVSIDIDPSRGKDFSPGKGLKIVRRLVSRPKVRKRGIGSEGCGIDIAIFFADIFRG